MTEKRKIIIVEAFSTGYNFIADCLERGYEPVILEDYYEDGEAKDEIEEHRNESYLNLKQNVKIIRALPEYSDTLEMIRKENPLLIIPGSEYGVILATRLSDDLGLVGNSYNNIEAMTNKAVQQRCLEKAGLRDIKGKVVTTEKEASEFFDLLDTEDVVVKPIRGAGSVGVRLCRGREEMLDAFRETQGSLGGLFHKEDELLIQEKITGTEYIVNTVTRNGKTALSSIWEYDKARLENGSNVYLGMRLVAKINEVHFELIRYAFQVVAALGIEYGPVHGEYMVDKNGPVLIEANCRCMGSSFPADFGDELYGHHETDLALDAYLSGELFDRYEKQDYEPKKFGVMKDLISSENINIRSSPIIQFLPHLRSYYKCTIQTAASRNSLKKTIDLLTSIGSVWLCHEEPGITLMDYQILCTLEKNNFKLLHMDDSDTCYFLGEKKYIDLEDLFFDLRSIIAKLKLNETLSFTKKEIDAFPYGRGGLTNIMRIFGMDLQAPHQNSKITVYKKSRDVV